MPSVRLEGVTKRYGRIVALDGISFEIKDTEYVALLGPSGCGKTTILKIIAGIVDATDGRVYIDGRDISNVPIEDRGIGFVFQNYALFPHLSVWENSAYGPTVKGHGHMETNRICKEMLDMVHLFERFDALPSELSGGMQQRVAIVRALCSGSKLLLLDEPMGALDAKIKAQLRYEIRNLVKDLRLTAVHVTHDQAEAMAVADKIVLVRKGRIAQVGTPAELYNKPATPFVANFIGDCNFFEGVLSQRGQRNYALLGGGLKLRISVPLKHFQNGEKVVVGIRPEYVSVASGEIENVISGVLERRSFGGARSRYEIKLETGGTVIASVPYSNDRFSVGLGLNVYLDPKKLFIFEFPRKGLVDELSVD